MHDLSCHPIFRFELPGVHLSRLKTRFLASYSSVDNSVYRHVHSDVWLTIMFLLIYLDSVSPATFVCLFYIYFFAIRFMVNQSYSHTRASHARSNPSALTDTHRSEEAVKTVAGRTTVRQLSPERKHLLTNWTIASSVLDHWRVTAST